MDDKTPISSDSPAGAAPANGPAIPTPIATGENPAAPAVLPLSVAEWNRYAIAWDRLMLACLIYKRKAFFGPN